VARASSGRTPEPKAARASGSTVQMAVQRALAEMDIAPGELEDDEYAVTVIRPAQEGFMGVGGVDAEVEVHLLVDREESPPQLEESTEDFDEESDLEDEEEDEEFVQPEPGSARLRELLTVILGHLNVEAKIRIIEKADSVAAELTGEDLGIIIGKRGQTIDAIEYLANVILYPHPRARKRVLVDAEGYKERRRQNIERVALRRAEEVVRRGRAVQLEPMTAAERKIVHLVLKDWNEILTESHGREPNRVVTISPVGRRGAR
jgi:spoIIIJ-associated protein